MLKEFKIPHNLEMQISMMFEEEKMEQTNS